MYNLSQKIVFKCRVNFTLCKMQFFANALFLKWYIDKSRGKFKSEIKLEIINDYET